MADKEKSLKKYLKEISSFCVRLCFCVFQRPKKKMLEYSLLVYRKEKRNLRGKLLIAISFHFCIRSNKNVASSIFCQLKIKPRRLPFLTKLRGWGNSFFFSILKEKSKRKFNSQNSFARFFLYLCIFLFSFSLIPVNIAFRSLRDYFW